MSPASEPRWARWLLDAALREDEAKLARSSLAELFAFRCARDGYRAAAWWYRRQVLGFVRRAMPLGVREPRNFRPRGGAALAATGNANLWSQGIVLAIRSLRREPGFAALAIATLAVGIGANTAIFSVIHGALLAPLPFTDPDRLVWLSDGHEKFGGGGANQSVPNLLDLRAGAQLMSQLAIFKVRSGNLSTVDEPQRVQVLYASSEMLGVLGTRPTLGRDLQPEDDAVGAEPVALLTDTFWRARFGGDPDLIGTTVTLDARPVRVIGVLPASFRFPDAPQVLMALQHEGASLSRGNRGHWSIARLAPGATIEELREELQGIFTGLVEAYPRANEGFFAWAQPLRDYVVGRSGSSLQILGAAVALVLLIACVNVANLLLVRAETRRGELAVRYALGATRAALLPLFLAEGLVLGLLGGALGILTAYEGVDLLVALYGDALPRADNIAINTTVLGFALGVSLFVGLAVALLPALRARPDQAYTQLRKSGRGTFGGTSRVGRILVATEVALAVVIVAAAGLLGSSMWRLQQIDLGVGRPDRVLTFRVSLPTTRYDAAAIGDFTSRLQSEVGDIPGIEAVALVNRLPLLGGDNMSVSAFADPDRVAHFVSMRMVAGDYLGATGTRLIDGRWLHRDELVDGGRGIVVNATLARMLFGRTEAAGERIVDPHRRPGSPGFSDDGVEIVGVIADIGGGRAGEAAPPAYYFSFAFALQMLAMQPDLTAAEQIPLSALVRTTGPPLAATAAIRERLSGIDAEVPIFAVLTLERIARDRLGTRRLAMSLFGVFALLALALGSVGIYGVMATGVAQRSREIGVRLALGATRANVLRSVLGQGLRMTLPGVAVGVAASVAVTRAMGSLLYEVSPLDPTTYAVVLSVLVVVGMAATYLPALRATRVDPASSMRVG